MRQDVLCAMCYPEQRKNITKVARLNFSEISYMYIDYISTDVCGVERG